MTSNPNPFLGGATWAPHTTHKAWRQIGDLNGFVRVEPQAKGYLWQAGKRYGYATTIDLAEAWVESVLENSHLPARYRIPL